MNFRVLSAQIAHETNTFSVRRTTLDSYRERVLFRGAEVAERLAGTNTEIGAHIDAARHFGWSLVQPIAAHATPSGRTTAEAWAVLSGAVLDACADGPFDGVLLALHGAMVTEDADDAEGDLLGRLRDRIGPDVPIAVTLDLHANVTDAMARHADILVAYRTYPHVDVHDVGMEAAGLLQCAMSGEFRPRTVVARGPLLDGCDFGRTQADGPMDRLLAKAARLRAGHGELLNISICAGFPWSDIAEAGPSVAVTGVGDEGRWRQVADELMKDVWDMRQETTVRLVGLQDTMARAVSAGAAGGCPLVIADATDNPGAGGYGDGVTLLRAMIEADLPNAALGCICDPEAVRQCFAAGPGASVNLTLGARIAPEAYGPPLVIAGIVEQLSDGAFRCTGPMWAGVPMTLGPTAVLRIGGVRAVVSSNNLQVTDRQLFLSQGIRPEDLSVVALKSGQHFRAAFAPMAREIVFVDSGGLASSDFRRFSYRKLRRPAWPLDPL